MVRELWDVRLVCGWWLEDVTWGWHRDVVHRMRVVQPHSPCTSHSSREVRLEAAIVEIRMLDGRLPRRLLLRLRLRLPDRYVPVSIILFSRTLFRLAAAAFILRSMLRACACVSMGVE